MKLVWISDPHLEFLSMDGVRSFLRSVEAHRPDALVITGDISTASYIQGHLTLIATSIKCPIYFLLGNHAFYGASFEAVEAVVREVCSKYPNLVHLGQGEIIPLNFDTALIGHCGWADGRAGRGSRSSIRLNDTRLIKDLTNVDTEELFQVLARLGDQSADYIRALAPQALSRSRNLIVGTHVPPWAEAALYQNKPSDADHAPHFVNAALGQALLDLAAAYPAHNITVLCGHTHHRAQFAPRPNLTVKVAQATYGMPSVAETISLSD